MKCYFSVKSESTDRMKKKQVLISFTIPDLGIIFRAYHQGEVDECSYICLLKLLRFIVSNAKIFEKQKIEIFSHDPEIVYQVNQKVPCEERLEKLNGLALVYKGKLKYSLDWIPPGENKAEKGIIDQPQIKSEIPLNFAELDESVRKKAGPPSNSRPPASNR